MNASEAVTEGIRIRVQSRYLASESDPKREHYFFAYTVRISNEGTLPAQLISRHWVIRDSHGARDDVRGPGVVGKQPHLEPGEQFEYTSACPLRTPLGQMQGTYLMQRDDGAEFEARIAPFSLAAPEVSG
ncbi:MAG: Co2+/Mg2+ efflux protein ApaG [Planctomycetes bacterium]|nr:Co2+/Mg2+ efflux protein ApaG [Planctomycetota bacterium]